MLTFWKKVAAEDSRNYRRFKAHCLIKYSLANKATTKKIVITPRDISADGTLFVSDTTMPKNALMEMDVYLPPLKDFFTVMGSVIRADKIKGTDQYLVAIRFTAMDPKERGSIDSYIDDVSKKPGMERFLDKKRKIVKRQVN